MSRALILAAGRGTRMRVGASTAQLTTGQLAAADVGLKAMIPFRPVDSARTRPFLDYVLHSLCEAGIEDVALVVSPAHDAIRTYYHGLRTSKIRISFVTQTEPLGTAHAVAAAETWADREPFIALNSDNLYPVDVLARLTVARGPAVPGFERDALGLPLSRIGSFALLERDDRGCLSHIVEKPGQTIIEAAGPASLISMNLWRFDQRIFSACREVPVSERGERELPQAVGLAAARGMCFEVIPVRGEVVDLSTREDVSAVARRLEGTRVEL